MAFIMFFHVSVLDRFQSSFAPRSLTHEEKQELKSLHGKTGCQTPHALLETHLRYCDEVRSEEDPRDSFQAKQIRCQRALAVPRRTKSCRTGECAKVRAWRYTHRKKKGYYTRGARVKKKNHLRGPGRGYTKIKQTITRGKKKTTFFRIFFPGIPPHWFYFYFITSIGVWCRFESLSGTPDCTKKMWCIESYAKRDVGGGRGAVIHPRFEQLLHPCGRLTPEKITKNLDSGLVSERVHGRGGLWSCWNISVRAHNA